jgi:hypothetical protein
VEPPYPELAWARLRSIDKRDPTIAYLKAKYRCTGEGTLWISVKQTAARTKDPALMEGESSQDLGRVVDEPPQRRDL